MVIAGIVAGGTGSRMGGTMPKQFLKVGGTPIILHTVRSFLRCSAVDAVVIGVHPDWKEYLEELLSQEYAASESNKGQPKEHTAGNVSVEQRLLVTAGGATRNDTILRMLDAADAQWGISDDTIVLTHDAVRPLVSIGIIEDNIRTAAAYGVCTTALPAVDTIAHSDNQAYVTDIPRRDEMYQVQTPQSFRYGLFREVHADITQEELAHATDVCKLFSLRGHKVYLVKGSAENFKITYPFDLRLAESVLASGGENS